MNIRTKIQDLLGISDLFRSISGHAAEHDRDLAAIRKQLNAIGPGLGRVIAKLDAKYGESEFTPERKAESDKLAEETIKRLNAEAAARRPYND